MPQTIVDLGRMVKQVHPGSYDDMTDEELGRKIRQKYPNDYKDFEPVGAITEKAKTRKMDLEADQQAQAAKDASNQLGGTLARNIGPMVGVGLASAATGGMAAIPAAALAAAGGFGGALAGEAGAAMAGDPARSKADLYKNLKLGAMYGAGGEVAGRVGNIALRNFLPNLTIKAANEISQGQETLGQLRLQAKTGLVDEVKQYVSNFMAKAGKVGIGVPGPHAAIEPSGEYVLDISPSLSKAQAALDQLNRGRGQTGDQYAMTSKAHGLLNKFTADLATNGRNTLQPLDVLAEMKGNLQQDIWGAGSGLSRSERTILEGLVKDINGQLTGELKNVSPQAKDYLETMNTIGRAQGERSQAFNIANKALGKLAGFSGGAAVGFGQGGPVGAGIGGAVGAALGAGVDAAVPSVANVALKQALAHPEGLRLVNTAVKFATLGQDAPALASMQRAFLVSGVRQWATDPAIRDVIRGQSLPPLPPPGSPETPE